jgi:hypothetical protein
VADAAKAARDERAKMRFFMQSSLLLTYAFEKRIQSIEVAVQSGFEMLFMSAFLPD